MIHRLIHRLIHGLFHRLFRRRSATADPGPREDVNVPLPPPSAAGGRAEAGPGPAPDSPAPDSPAPDSSAPNNPAPTGGFALADLDAALIAGLERLRPLLASGELHAVRALLACAAPARALWARLFNRAPRPLPIAALLYDEVGPPGPAADELESRGVATLGPFGMSELLCLHTLPSLQAIARGLGCATRGPRAALEGRLQAHPGARARLQLPAIALRHRGLVARLVRAHLLDHEDGLRALVLDRLGHRRLPEHPITGGALYPHRRALLAHEEARARWGGPSPPPPEETIEATRALIRACAGWPPGAGPRLSPLRLAIPAAAEVARAWEREGRCDEALALIDELLPAAAAAGPAQVAELERRAALCLEALGRPGEAAARCARARDHAPAVSARALERTGLRLTRVARFPWIPLAPLREPPERTLTLPMVGSGGPRPLWGGPGGVAEVEPAAAGAVSAMGRSALRAENSPWTTLFALLMRGVLYAPVAGMLCGRGMPRPLDLGEPGFAARREGAIRAALQPIAAGQAPALLEAAWSAHAGEAIAGARWGHCSRESLAAIAAATPGPALAAILRAMAEDWRGARSGLPDLCVLPGPAGRVPGLFPSTLPEGILLVEVKGPGDAPSDGQRVWFDRLLSAGLRVEVWKVRPPGPAARLG